MQIVHLRSKKGFTIVEMMVALSVFAVLSVSAMALLDASSDMTEQSEMQMSLQVEMKKVLNRVSQELRGSSTSSPTPISTSSGQITFQIPTEVTGGSISAWSTIQYVLQEDGSMQRTQDGVAQLIASDITSFEATYPADAVEMPTGVRIEISAARQTLERTLTADSKVEVLLRNG